MRVFVASIILLLLSLFAPSNASARVLPQAKTAGRQTAVKSAGNNIIVGARLRRDRRALTVFFGNLQTATSVSYILTYQTQGKEEGAGGSVRQDEGNSATRELLFGTCSKNDCTYHVGISNMKLQVTGQLKNSKTFTKGLKIKV